MARGRPLSAPGPFGYQPVWHELRRRGVSQATAAAEANVAYSWFSAVLRGLVAPTIGTAKRIAKVVGAPIEELFTAEVRSFMREDRSYVPEEVRARWRRVANP